VRLSDDHGILTKEDGLYGLTLDSAVFLDKRSPAYMGTVSDFMLSPHIKGNFDNLTESVRKGGSAAKQNRSSLSIRCGSNSRARWRR